MFALLQPGRLLAALLEVDLNPVRTGLTGEATAWERSSARAHMSRRDESGLMAWGRSAEYSGCGEWEERLQRGQAQSTADALRRAACRLEPRRRALPPPQEL